METKESKRVGVRRLADGDTLLREEMLAECKSMVRYALASGLPVSARILKGVEAFSFERRERMRAEGAGGEYHFDPADGLDIRELSFIHEKLSRAIDPATPRTVVLLDPEFAEPSPFRFLGPVPLVRKMMGIAILFLIAFITVVLSPEVNNKPGTGDLLSSSGEGLLVNLIFYIAAAGLGASFSALFQANQYIVKGTFDPKYEASYWIRFVLGVIAGIILAGLVPFEGDTLQGFGKPTLAMLGGFSSSLVYRILNRLVSAVESMVRGDPQDELTNKMRETQLRADEELTQERGRVAAGLVELQKQLSQGASTDEMREQLNGMLAKMIALDPEELAPAKEGAPAASPAAGKPAPEKTSAPAKTQSAPPVAAPADEPKGSA